LQFLRRDAVIDAAGFQEAVDLVACFEPE